MLDRHGRIDAVNDAWVVSATANGGDLRRCGQGVSYLEVSRRAAECGDDEAQRMHELLESLVTGRTDEGRLRYACARPSGVEWYDMHLRRVGRQCVVVHRDVTEAVAATVERERSERRYRALVDQSPEAVCVVDAAGVVLFASPGVERLLGRRADSLIGTDSMAWLHPDDRVRLTAKLEHDVSTSGPAATTVLRMQHADGSWRWIEAIPTVLLDDPEIGGLVVNSRDVTDRVRADRHAAAQRRVLDLVARGAPRDDVVRSLCDGVDGDLEGAECRITVGRGPQGMPPGRTPRPIRGEHDGSTVGVLWCATASLERADDTTRRQLDSWLSLAAVAIQRANDLHDLEHAARHDTLTGLASRSHFLSECRRVLDGAAAHRADAIVVLLDLDRFKSVNDTLGHHVGDDLLVDVARRIAAVCRAGDVVARLGGDEFAVCAAGIGPADAPPYVERLLAAARGTVQVRSSELFVTSSAGYVVVERGDDRRVGEVVRDADVALYEAKEHRRGAAVCFDRTLRDRVTEAVELEAALAHAIRHDELRLEFQPIVEVGSRDVHAVEALARWSRDGREVPPSSFVRVAEESGLILGLGAWVLDGAVAAAAVLRRELGATAPRVAVNVAPAQLLDPDFDAALRRRLEEHGVPGRSICLEITESALVDVDHVAGLLDRLRWLGVEVHLDDFGTGYSSLAYLQTLALDAIKLDRRFVSELATRTNEHPLAPAIVSIADALQLDVVAEGVETDDQHDLVHRLGCRYAQGFLYARPMSLADTVDHVRATSERRSPVSR